MASIAHRALLVHSREHGEDQRYFGYEEHTLVQCPGSRQKAGEEPRLIRRLEVTPAGTDVVDVSLAIIDRSNARSAERWANRGHLFVVGAAQRVLHLVVDRHYHYKEVERWWDQLFARGVDQHLTLRADEHGFTEGKERARWAAGSAHCPGTPEDLGTILRPGPNEPKSKHDAFNEQIDRREHFALPRVSAYGADGSHRVKCPALAGMAGCPLRGGTVQAALRLGLPMVDRPPDAERDGEPLPRCCTQSSVVVVPPALVRKLMQLSYWGSEKWRRVYEKRTYVEGSYGNRKNTRTENLRRGQFRFTGIAWVNIVAGLSAASYNLRMVRNWHERTGKGDPAHPLFAAPEPDYGFVRLSQAEREALLRQCLEARRHGVRRRVSEGPGTAGSSSDRGPPRPPPDRPAGGHLWVPASPDGGSERHRRRGGGLHLRLLGGSLRRRARACPP